MPAERSQTPAKVDNTEACALRPARVPLSGPGWGENGALDAVTEFAEAIDAIARRIEDALHASERDAATRETAAA